MQVNQFMTFDQHQTVANSAFHVYSPPLTIASLLRQKSFLQCKLKEVELQLEEKQYCWQEIQRKSNENRENYDRIAKDFQQYKRKHQLIDMAKQKTIQHLTSQLFAHNQISKQIQLRLDDYELMVSSLNRQNGQLKKQLITKNKFIDCYLRKTYKEEALERSRREIQKVEQQDSRTRKKQNDNRNLQRPVPLIYDRQDQNLKNIEEIKQFDESSEIRRQNQFNQ